MSCLVLSAIRTSETDLKPFVLRTTSFTHNNTYLNCEPGMAHETHGMKHSNRACILGMFFEKFPKTAKFRRCLHSKGNFVEKVWNRISYNFPMENARISLHDLDSAIGADREFLKKHRKMYGVPCFIPHYFFPINC